MDITLPSDCGNSPRLGIVGQFTVNWVNGDVNAIREWLSADATWRLIGTLGAEESAGESGPPFAPERARITSVITHGRLASCDGYLEAGERRMDFSHVFRFASTARSAKIVELRSYCIESSAS